MHVQHLLFTGFVERAKLAAGGRIKDAIEIGVHAAPGFSCLLGDTKATVRSASTLARLDIALVEVLESGGEAGRDAVLFIEGNGTLNRLVGDGVAVGKVLGHDAGTRFVLLGYCVWAA